MPRIILYQYEISPFADKVRRTLHIKNLAYETREVLPSEANKWKKVSPTGKFPAMDYDETRIVDSTNIIRYLDEKHPAPQLIPSSPRDLALAHILEDWADESLYYYDLAIRSKANNVDRLVEDVAGHETGLKKVLISKVLPGAAGKIANGQGLGRKTSDDLAFEIEKHFAAIDALLNGQEWLCGNSISIADIAIASMVYVLIRAEEPAAMLPQFQALSAWRDKVDEATGVSA
ncbi:MAG: glutathione S-transferase family protein [Pseudomonadota bacterium]